MGILLRTGVFWLCAFFSLLILCPFIFFFRGNDKAQQRMAQLWGKLLVFLGGVQVEIGGVDALHSGRSYVLMANHQSYFDIFILLTLPVFIVWIAKKELFHIPIFGWMLKWHGAISIDREKKLKAYSSIRQAVAKVRNGASVLIFPEGTRSASGELLPLNKGGFSLAILSRSPILPITINGSYKIMKKGSFLVTPGLVRISIHSPVDTDSLTLRDRDQLQERIEAVFSQDLKSSSLPSS